MHTDQFAKLALGEAKRSPSGPHHDGQMGPPALFCASFNNFFAAHELDLITRVKHMIYKINYTKADQYINGSKKHLISINGCYVSILGFTYLIYFISIIFNKA